MKTHAVYGIHAVQSVLRSEPARVHALYADTASANRRLCELLAFAVSAGVKPMLADGTRLAALAGGARHQGVVVLCAARPADSEAAFLTRLADLAEPPLVLVLDGVQDPHNLGACLRAADGAGAHGVIAPRDGSCGMTPVVEKVASGAAESVAVCFVVNLRRTLGRLRDAGLWVVGAADDAAEDLFHTDLGGPLALVLGAEHKGLRRLTREHCDRVVKIPMYGSVTSLNVAVAAGVMLYEARRRRL